MFVNSLGSMKADNLCHTGKRIQVSLEKTQSTPGGQNLPADPPSFGLMLPNKLLLIFMKELNAFWCKKKKKNLNERRKQDGALSPKTYNLPFGVGKVCKINLFLGHTVTAVFIFDTLHY